MAETEKQKPERYDPKEVEPRIQKFWEERKIFAFDRNSRKQVFSIDTPPPYPSGEFHMGNMLNWSYIDFIARYRRMHGFNVQFPQGFDVHGLPTEVKVEQKFNIKSSEVPRKEWIKMCEEWTNNNIVGIKQMMNRFGFSIDWSQEYKTSDASYMKTVQQSFLDLREKGLLYRGKHPINFCTRCETAIADAEVEYASRQTKLNFIKFNLAGEGNVIIATTRPEMLHACVGMAANPEDERYKNIIGRKAVVPIFGQEVEIFSSKDVDLSFGTGIVMICTFGDKQDVEWSMKHKLPIIDAIDRKGNIINAGKYSGLSIAEGRKRVLEDLKKIGVLFEQKDLEQNVGLCWRCKHVVEIINMEQWFVAVTKLRNKVIEETKKAKWIPEYMAIRQANWTESMTWDWVISRQKVYGTPIPVWYCKCGNIMFADAKELPVDTAEKEKRCEKCGSKATGEKDTMDTWMDSSVTIAYHAGWPDKFDKRLYPADVQPNGTDIIRTWDYYLMARHLALFGSSPYKTVVVNGMVMGEDGRKMSKSLGNYVTAREALEKSSADTLRFWAASGGSTGNDIPFSWKDIDHAQKFTTKLWNIFNFCRMNAGAGKVQKKNERTIIDKWITSRLCKTISAATKSMDEYQFNMALTEIENFVWHEIADNYLEMIKYRLYDKDDKTRHAAMKTLYDCLYVSIKLLTPFMPFVTEEIYQKFFKEKDVSIHISKWPEFDEKLIDEKAEEIGELAKQIISALRQYKSSRKLALNTELKKIIIDCDKEMQEKLKQVEPDIKGTMKVKEIGYGKADEISVSEKIRINVLA